MDTVVGAARAKRHGDDLHLGFDGVAHSLRHPFVAAHPAVPKDFEGKNLGGRGDALGQPIPGGDNAAHMGAVPQGVMGIRVAGEVPVVHHRFIQGRVLGNPAVDHGHRHTLTPGLLPQGWNPVRADAPIHSMLEGTRGV